MSNVFYIKGKRNTKETYFNNKGRLIFQMLKGLKDILKGIQVSITNLL